MELHRPPGMSGEALPVVEAYLDRLGADEPLKARLREAARAAPDARAGLAAVHAALANDAAPGEVPAFDSIAARLALALNGDAAMRPSVSGTDLQGHVRLVTTPPFNRSSMTPRGWLRSPFSRTPLPAEGPFRPSVKRADWGRTATFRRALLLVLTIAQTVLASWAMSEILPYKGTRVLEIAILFVFVILFAWISSGFWTAIAGFFLLMRGRDKYAAAQQPVVPLSGEARTALVMPICNEDVGRVFAGLQATCESLERTGEARHFDVFVLSDSGDPDIRVAETVAWLGLRRAMGDRVRVHYRWRQHHIKRKSGNIADFCRRWGADYKYMVVLDADSVMTGACLVRLAQLMEVNTDAGIIQTAPRAFGRETLFARVQQFATAAYGPLFTAGLHFWQLGEAHYWGHNAIIRVEPFMQHCALGRLPGTGALSGEILSHDFVEAALMRRAGWGVWIAYDLPGSYEEVPPNLIDELTRDRRWCLGNLMNLRLFHLEGLHPAHRAVFMIGVMAYVSAPLWFLSLALGTALLAQHTLEVPPYFTEPHQLFPNWPEWHPEQAIALFGSTALVLFLPKVFATVLIWVRGERAFGRGIRAAISVAIETVFSALFAPIRMIFHTQFVTAGLAGIAIKWKSPPREDTQTRWGQALRRHGLHTLLGIAWTAFVWWLDPRVLPWVLPVAGALVLSIPLSVLSSRVDLGRFFRRLGLFATPEELHPFEEIVRTKELARTAREGPGLEEAVMDPRINALAAASGTPRFHESAAALEEREALVAKALREGLPALTRGERSRLLNDPIALSRLHLEAWAGFTTPAGRSPS
ncbi:glucan biosynthesis glucosyltransferase H [Betaproteobacteria bacterium GR16-43]|nr:glucan biosynthesis glucosyltransferase H [Betaproteobacteria bacterium GR16-43]